MSNNEINSEVDKHAILTTDMSTSRFNSAVWYEAMKDIDVIIAGVGGIGSYVAFLVSRLKPGNIILYDSDKVESTNLSGQLYGIKDVDMYKVDSMANMISNYSQYYRVNCIPTLYTSEASISKIMICGFDNMRSRNLFFGKWYEGVKNADPEDRKNYLLIDGRLAAENFQIFCLAGDKEEDITEYKEKWIFTDEEADPTMCSYKQTSYVAAMIGSIITNLLVNFVTTVSTPGYTRYIPFKTTFNAESINLDITL